MALFVLFGLGLGLMAAYFISQGDWPTAFALAALFPFLFVLVSQPFLGIVLWLLLMPFHLAFPNSSLAYWAIYRILTPVTLILVMLSRGIGARLHFPARLGPPEAAMGILVLYVPAGILLTQQSSSVALIRFSDRILLTFCMYLMVRLIAPREKEFKQLQWVALFIALSQSVIGFLSWFAPQTLPHAWQYLQGARTTGSVKDPDLYAALLTFCAVILIHAAIHYKSGWVRYLFFLASGLCAIFIFLSLERAAWLGGVLVLIGLVVLYPRVMLRLIIVSAIIIPILGAGILSAHFSLSLSRLTESSPVYDRIVVFDAMFQMVQQKPVFGWGYETLDQNISHYYRRIGEASLVTRLVTSHNTYLTVLTELGLVGFMLYMFPIVWWLVLSFRVWPRMPKEGLWSRQLLGVLWLVMLFNFTVSNFMDMRWFPTGLTLWWMVLGLIANMVYPYLKIRSLRSPVYERRNR